jgi:hypothetical protein
MVLREKERFALIRRTDRQLDRLAIFIHGFRGNYWTTWGGLPHLLNTEADTGMLGPQAPQPQETTESRARSRHVSNANDQRTST